MKQREANDARPPSQEELVVRSPGGEMLSYEWYFRTLRRYCKSLGINVIGTHGLRHSTSELYLSHGASRDDIRQLFAHSSSHVTDRYIHHHGTSLEKVADVIQLFPEMFHVFHAAETAGNKVPEKMFHECSTKRVFESGRPEGKRAK